MGPRPADAGPPGQDLATEAEIAQAAEALLDKAEHGPGCDKPSKKDQRVAGRTRAVSAAERPLPKPQPQSPSAWDDEAEDDEDTGQLAEVIPLGIFDAHEEGQEMVVGGPAAERCPPDDPARRARPRAGC